MTLRLTSPHAPRVVPMFLTTCTTIHFGQTQLRCDMQARLQMAHPATAARLASSTGLHRAASSRASRWCSSSCSPRTAHLTVFGKLCCPPQHKFSHSVHTQPTQTASAHRAEHGLQVLLQHAVQLERLARGQAQRAVAVLQGREDNKTQGVSADSNSALHSSCADSSRCSGGGGGSMQGSSSSSGGGSMQCSSSMPHRSCSGGDRQRLRQRQASIRAVHGKHSNKDKLTRSASSSMTRYSWQHVSVRAASRYTVIDASPGPPARPSPGTAGW